MAPASPRTTASAMVWFRLKLMHIWSSSPVSSPKKRRTSSGSRLTSPIRRASPWRRPRNARNSHSHSWGARSTRPAIPAVSSRKGRHRRGSRTPPIPARSRRSSGFRCARRVGDVEVRLLLIETVEIILLGFLVPFPVAVSPYRERPDRSDHPLAAHRARHTSRGTASCGRSGTL